MGAQWKHAGRIASSSKRGAFISKIVKEIQIASKTSGPIVDNNPRLRAAVEAAKKQSVPKDTIDRAIKKGAGLIEGAAQYEQIIYEGFAPHQVPVLIECQTDNKNRTAADIRVLFRKGQLGSAGTVGWMFIKVGIIEALAPNAQAMSDPESLAIEAGAQAVEPIDSGLRLITEPQDLDLVATYLSKNNWKIEQSELGFQAKNMITLANPALQEVIDFMDAIDEHEDVHRIYTPLKLN